MSKKSVSFKQSTVLISIRLLFICTLSLILPISFCCAADSDAEYTHIQTDIQIKNNKLYTTHEYEITINNHKGDKYAQISIPYSKLIKISKLEAFIKDKDGNIVKKLKTSDITVRSSIADFSLYEDDFVKEFSLAHNVYPYSVFYSYQEQQDFFINIVNWSPAIYTEIPTLKSILTIETSKNYQLRYKNQQVDSFRVDSLENSIKYRWVASYQKQIETEILMPDLRLLVPMVTVVPLNFNYELEGSFKSWQSFGNWEYRLIEPLNDLPSEEIVKINSLVQDTKDNKERIKILYHYLQDETRYVNVTIKTGGMKPYPASYVAVNKYGDCKALTNYFKSLLKTIGIESFYTNVYADEVCPPILSEFPSQQFNHIILCVPLNNDTLWLDCTSDGPFNRLGTFTQNRDVLIIDKLNSRILHTPRLTEKDVLETRRVTIETNLTNSSSGSFHNVFRGKKFEQLSAIARSVNAAKLTQIIRNDFIENDLDLLDCKLIESQRDSDYITLNYNVKADKLCKNYGNEHLIKILPFSIPSLKDVKHRRQPVQISYPINKIDTIEYILPAGATISNSLKETHLKSALGAYNTHYYQFKNKVTVIKDFTLHCGIYSVEEYKDFYDFIKSIYDYENNNYLIISKNSAL